MAAADIIPIMADDTGRECGQSGPADAERQASELRISDSNVVKRGKHTQTRSGEKDAASSSSCLSTVYLTLAQTDMNGLSSTLHNWQQFNI